MSHVRQQIRTQLVTELTGLAATGNRVYASRVKPVDDSKLPCLLVNTDEETVDAATVHAQGLLDRRLTVTVRALVKSATPDTALDTIISQVETAIGNTDLNGLVKTLLLNAIEIDLDGEGEKPVGSAVLKFEANYMTQAATPDTAI